MRASTIGFGFAFIAVVVGVPLVAACRKTEMLTPDGCNGLISSARVSVTSAIKSSSRACTSDRECVEVQPIACVPGCGGFAVHLAQSASVAAAVRRADDEACTRWTASECPKIAPLPYPSCPRLTPACNSGTCDMKVDFPTSPN